jgi:hypothetical protein
MGQAQSGPQGLIGPQGSIGPKGEPSNIPGPQGLIGPQGPIGPKGEPSNIPGPQGLIGPQGSIGPKGEPSNIPGPQGLIGPQGSIGSIGPKGEPSNIPGPQGLLGPVGPQGPQGLIGPQGSIGPKGETGEVTYNYMKQNTLWCADGDICKLPPGKKVLDWGVGGSRIYEDGQLHIQSDDNVFVQIADDNGYQFTKDNLYMMQSKALQFGQGYDREENAGQISYGRHDGGQEGSLNIVGAGKAGKARVVRVWDTLRIGDTHLRQDYDWLRLLGDQNDLNSYNRGLAAKNLWSKEKLWVNDRDILAEIDGLKAGSNNIKLGGTNINQDDNWVRLLGNKDDMNSYNRGLAAKNLWSREKLWVNDRDILAEIDNIRNDFEGWKKVIVRNDRWYAVQNKDNRRLQMSGDGARATGSGNWGNWEGVRFIQGD